jgi:hypothetical protein
MQDENEFTNTIMDKKSEVIVLLVYSGVIIDCFKLSFHKNR